MRGNVEQRDIAIQQGLGGEQLRTHEPQARQTHGELPGRSVGGRMELQLTTQVEAQLQDPCHAASELVSSRNVESCCEGEGPCREGRHIHAKLHSPEKLALVFDDLTCGHAFSAGIASASRTPTWSRKAAAENHATPGSCAAPTSCHKVSSARCRTGCGKRGATETAAMSHRNWVFCNSCNNSSDAQTWSNSSTDDSGNSPPKLS
mmetsp:Transcript_57318/g.185690  ORF Transcript_57318/g.185690 Transcript_57318/m.185690 type:complete len:205 (+) Transcript_57318:734-1348(+)